MTTSASFDFIVSTKDILVEALELCGVLGEGQDPTTDQVVSTLRTLNMMTKTWQAVGLNLFAVQELFLFLQKTQSEYDLKGTTTDHITDSFTETTTSAAAIATATQVVLTSATGIAVGDYIGIKLDTGDDVEWTTVSGIGSTPTIDITTALSQGVDSGATVYYYTTKAQRPMKVLEAYTHRAGGVDVPCAVIARVDWGELANKTSSGVTNQVYFNPQVGTSKLTVWPVTDSELDYMRLFVQRTLSDFDCLNNTPDYPQEWFLPLAYNLALMIAPKHGVPPKEYVRIRDTATNLYAAAEGFDDESETSVFFKPDTDWT